MPWHGDSCSNCIASSDGWHDGCNRRNNGCCLCVCAGPSQLLYGNFSDNAARSLQAQLRVVTVGVILKTHPLQIVIAFD